jgi:hypothetical protein
MINRRQALLLLQVALTPEAGLLLKGFTSLMHMAMQMVQSKMHQLRHQQQHQQQCKTSGT